MTPRKFPESGGKVVVVVVIVVPVAVAVVAVAVAVAVVVEGVVVKQEAHLLMRMTRK